MKEVRYSTKFKKDIRRYAHNAQKLEALYNIVRILERGSPIPRTYRPHQLKGKYKGCWECHIENDYLLIWINEEEQSVCLERIGTHHELFGR